VNPCYFDMCFSASFPPTGHFRGGSVGYAAMAELRRNGDC
jgi:hypothetical protein